MRTGRDVADVVPDHQWRAQLHADLVELPPGVAASQGRILVPRPAGRRPTDWERQVIGLETAFSIQLSNDATTWTSIYSTTTGTGGTQTINVSGTGRYVRLYMTARATQYGDSVFEFAVHSGTSS